MVLKVLMCSVHCIQADVSTNERTNERNPGRLPPPLRRGDVATTLRPLLFDLVLVTTRRRLVAVLPWCFVAVLLPCVVFCGLAVRFGVLIGCSCGRWVVGGWSVVGRGWFAVRPFHRTMGWALVWYTCVGPFTHSLRSLVRSFAR